LKQNIRTKDTYKKRYRMNVVGREGATTTVAIPPEVIERKAEEAGLTPDEFIKQHQVVAHYDNFDGVFYAFEKIKSKGETNGKRVRKS